MASAPLMIQVGPDDWVRICSSFSPDARVTAIDLPLQVVPFDVDIPVAGFIWPTPSHGVTVHVREPHPAQFADGLAAAGVVMPAREGLPGLDIVPDDEHSVFPGSVSDRKCPSCKTPAMHYVSSADLVRAGRVFAAKTGKAFSFVPCIKHGGHAYMDESDLWLLRCPGCMDLYFLCAVSPWELVRFDEGAS